jgi:aspartate/methionine/tyrosine aminotransferase
MGAPAQLALPAWLEARGAMQAQIAARTAGNLAALRDREGVGVLQTGVLRVEAGWAAVLLLRGWEAPARRLLAECGVVVHPGEFYGLGDARMVVVSLLTPEGVFQEGLERVARAGGGNQAR